jgi:plastocyanin
MNKTIVGIMLAILAVGAIAGAVILNRTTPAKDTQSTDMHTERSAVESTANSNQTQSTQASEATESNKVNIVDTSNSYDFSPKKITVKKGTTVKWTNQSTTKHDVSPTPETSDFKKSELMAKGETYEVTFNTVGTFSYICSPHPFMKGTVEVVE